jgi:hypothetical protein
VKDQLILVKTESDVLHYDFVEMRKTRCACIYVHTLNTHVKLKRDDLDFVVYIHAYMHMGILGML